MSKFIRLTGSLLCLGVLALGLVAFDLACQRTSHLPGEPKLRPSMADEVARREQLKQVEEDLLRRTEAKRYVAEEVIAEQLSLAEAIEQFEALDRQWFELSPWIKKSEETLMSLHEWSGRDVLRYVQLVLADRPDEAAAVAGRLEKELQELLADRKTIRSPPAESSR